MGRLVLVSLLLAVLLVSGCGLNSSESTQGEQATQGEREAKEGGCDPNYAGACLDPYAYDYDCEGGSGDGPLYTGVVTVVGEDHYGLDADGDGVGCEL